MEGNYKRESTNITAETGSSSDIKITAKGPISRYIRYGSSLLLSKNKEIVLRAMGQATYKAVIVAELIKRKFPRLHQYTSFDTTQIVETYNPLVEGLEKQQKTKKVSSITIRLTKEPLGDEASKVGYQAPSPNARSNFVRRRGGRASTRGRGRGRGGLRGRGRGGLRGGRGGFRGGRGTRRGRGGLRGGMRRRGGTNRVVQKKENKNKVEKSEVKQEKVES